MNEIWAVLIPILIADVVNPVLFASMVYAAGTKRPIMNSGSILLGHTLAYFCAGLVLALGLDQITDRLLNPQQVDYFIGLLIGILLLGVAFRPRKESKKSTTVGSGDLTPLKALGLGAVVNFVGIPFALPYFAALDQILKADLAATESVIVLIGYNLLYPLPFIFVPALVSVFGERSGPLLQRINDLLNRVSSFLMPVLLFLAGIALVIDAIRYFVTGEGLF